MASNLNSFSAKENVTPVLIPPSEFEKPARFRSKNVQETQRQFEHLPLKADEIKHFQSHLQAPITAPCSHLKNDYADELIRRQAGEIAELRSELVKCRQIFEQEIADWKKRFSLLDEYREAEVKALEKQLAISQDEFNVKLSQKESETSTLSERLERTQMLLDRQVKELQEELSSVRLNSDSSVRQLESDLRTKSQTVEDQKHHITKLKTYICETDETQRPALAWKMEKEALDNKLKISQAEIQKLNSTLELLDVRFQALNDILSVQEKELDQAKVGSAGKSKQACSLITRWREKVFSLLVQQKSSEILHKKDITNMHYKMQRIEEQLTASQAQVQVLQHSLIDKTAQLQIEINKTQSLRQELEQTNQVAICLDDQSKQDYYSVKTLSDLFEKTKNQTDDLMRILSDKSGVLKMLCQRVSFASSRMEFIKTQLIRKSALSLVVSKDAVQALPVGQDVSRSRNGEGEELMSQELEKVTRERDSLAAQIRADTEKWSEILREAKSQYGEEIESLTKRFESMDFQMQQKSKNCVQLTEEVESLKEDVSEKDNLITHLKTELSRHERGIETILTDQKLKDEAEWSQRLADLDRKLNSSKREHAKAVVSLRQAENCHKRRLQQEQELLNTTEAHLTRQIQQLESRLKSVEVERNLMMVTLKQEGLLDQLKSDRGKYIKYVDDTDTVEKVDVEYTNNGKLTTENVDTRTFDFTKHTSDESEMENYSVKIITTSDMTPRIHEPVENVLEDLKSLTAAIFDDDHDDGEEDEDESARQDDSDGVYK